VDLVHIARISSVFDLSFLHLPQSYHLGVYFSFVKFSLIFYLSCQSLHLVRLCERRLYRGGRRGRGSYGSYGDCSGTLFRGGGGPRGAESFEGVDRGRGRGERRGGAQRGD
jgi:hypothetical protein